MRIFIVILSILFAVAAGWYLGARFGFRLTPGNSAKDAVEIHSQVIVPDTVFGQGKLVPAKGLINIVAPPGERIETMTSKQVGDVVGADEFLVTLGSRVLREKDLELAKARRNDALENLDYEKQQASFKLNSARLALEEANASNQKIAEQAKAIPLLEIQLADAQSLLARLQSLQSDPATEKLVNRTDIDKQSLLVKQLSFQVQQAQSDLELANNSALRAQQIARNNLDTVEYAIAHADDASPLGSLDAAVALAQQAFDLTKIESPLDNATILNIFVRAGDSVTNQPIMVLGDLTEMRCEVELVDSLLKLIDLKKHNNLRAKITGNALTEPLMGTVISKGILIGPVTLKSPNPFGRVDQRTGVLTIKLDDSKAAAELVNLQVDVNIETRPGALKIPTGTSLEETEQSK